jgi:hypothetical protein
MAYNTDIEGYYFDGNVTKRQMKGLAWFAEKFAQDDFELGHFQETPVRKAGPRKPTFILSDMANDFITYCINEGVVDLRLEDRAEWNFGKIAMGGNMVADATPQDLVEMLTYIVGNHVHWQSRLINAYQSGLLQQILDRAVVLVHPKKVDGPLLLEQAD